MIHTSLLDWAGPLRPAIFLPRGRGPHRFRDGG